jgi:hypothetical protein
LAPAVTAAAPAREKACLAPGSANCREEELFEVIDGRPADEKPATCTVLIGAFVVYRQPRGGDHPGAGVEVQRLDRRGVVDQATAPGSNFVTALLGPLAP